MGRKNRKINRALRVTRARVAGLAMDAQRTQATANHSLALANRAVNETKALVTKHALHDDEITRTHAALAAINKEQDVQRVAHTLLDAAIGQIMADVKELRADVVRLSDLVAPLNEEATLLRRYMGARIEGDKYGPVITAEHVAKALGVPLELLTPNKVLTEAEASQVEAIQREALRLEATRRSVKDPSGTLRTVPQAGDVVYYTPDGERYGPPNAPDREDATITNSGDLQETEGARCDHWYTYGLMGQRTRCTLTLGHDDRHWYMRSRPTDAPPLTRPVLGPAGDINVGTFDGDVNEFDTNPVAYPPGVSATVTNIFHGGVDIPIPTYTTPSEVCAPPPTDLIPIQVAVGSIDGSGFDIDRVKEAIVSILDRPEWRRDEGAYEYDTTANGWRVTITHTNGAVLTDNEIHDALWKVIGYPDQEEN